jgi:hypothetical protein
VHKLIDFLIEKILIWSGMFVVDLLLRVMEKMDSEEELVDYYVDQYGGKYVFFTLGSHLLSDKISKICTRKISNP